MTVASSIVLRRIASAQATDSIISVWQFRWRPSALFVFLLFLVKFTCNLTSQEPGKTQDRSLRTRRDIRARIGSAPLPFHRGFRPEPEFAHLSDPERRSRRSEEGKGEGGRIGRGFPTAIGALLRRSAGSPSNEAVLFSALERLCRCRMLINSTRHQKRLPRQRRRQQHCVLRPSQRH